MKERTKIFFENDTIDLEHRVNTFLENTKGKLHSFSYSYIVSKNDEWYCTAMLIILPEGEEYENEEDCCTKEDEKSHARVQRRISPLWEQERACCKV